MIGSLRSLLGLGTHQNGYLHVQVAVRTITHRIRHSWEQQKPYRGINEPYGADGEKTGLYRRRFLLMLFRLKINNVQRAIGTRIIPSKFSTPIVGGHDRLATFKVMPTYPAAARREGVRRKVTSEVFIDRSGTLVRTCSQGGRVLANAVDDALIKWSSSKILASARSTRSEGRDSPSCHSHSISTLMLTTARHGESAPHFPLTQCFVHNSTLLWACREIRAEILAQPLFRQAPPDGCAVPRAGCPHWLLA